MAVVLNREIPRSSPVTVADPVSLARVLPPSFTYRGNADPHWRGQGCYLIGPSTAEQRKIVLACGCYASVPWWTLEPVE